jgi:hypothetical protein
MLDCLVYCCTMRVKKAFRKVKMVDAEKEDSSSRSGKFFL